MQGYSRLVHRQVCPEEKGHCVAELFSYFLDTFDIQGDVEITKAEHGLQRGVS
jgi:hypothetical protein